jgi:hypothetical protein
MAYYVVKDFTDTNVWFHFQSPLGDWSRGLPELGCGLNEIESAEARIALQSGRRR